jgi:DNA-binding response OmpR family regulator
MSNGESRRQNKPSLAKILIIEDHPDMNQILVWQIELMGYLAISAKLGKEGLEKALYEQ